MEHVQLTLHACPWLPTRDTQMVVELNGYDGPLLGILRQRKALFLFHCLVGELDPEQVWVYAGVTDDEVAELAGAEDPDRLAVSVQAIESDRPVTLAHAHEEAGLLASVSGVLLSDAQAEVGDLRQWALRQLATHVQEHADELSRLTAAAS